MGNGPDGGEAEREGAGTAARRRCHVETGKPRLTK